MYKSNIDLAILVIFHARYSTLEKVFDSIRIARPSTLLLWQDGPRKGNIKDLDGIQRCREGEIFMQEVQRQAGGTGEAGRDSRGRTPCADGEESAGAACICGSERGGPRPD